MKRLGRIELTRTQTGGWAAQWFPDRGITLGIDMGPMDGRARDTFREAWDAIRVAIEHRHPDEVTTAKARRIAELRTELEKLDGTP